MRVRIWYCSSFSFRYWWGCCGRKVWNVDWLGSWEGGIVLCDRKRGWIWCKVWGIVGSWYLGLMLKWSVGILEIWWRVWFKLWSWDFNVGCDWLEKGEGGVVLGNSSLCVVGNGNWGVVRLWGLCFVFGWVVKWVWGFVGGGLGCGIDGGWGVDSGICGGGKLCRLGKGMWGLVRLWGLVLLGIWGCKVLLISLWEWWINLCNGVLGGWV